MLERLEDRTTPSSVSGLSLTSGPTAGGTILQVNGSQATLTLSTLPTGSDPVIAVYGGDANYGGSSSTTLNQIVENNGAFVWTGAVSNDWDVAGNWLVNDQTATTDPGQNADVIFSGVGETDPNCYTNGAVTVNSLTLDAPYTGTLSLAGSLNVAATFDFEGGNINQPGAAGVSADVTVMGNFNWVAGVLNAGNTLANIYLAGNATLGGTSLNTGDNIELGKAPQISTLKLNTTASLGFVNNAGISLASGAVFDWSGTAYIVTTGTGLITNNGGDFEKSSAAGIEIKCDLPYVNNNPNAALMIEQGTLDFDRAGGTNNASVYQATGTIKIGMGNNGTLEVDQGLTMDGGRLITPEYHTSTITGNLTINGGDIDIGSTAPSTLNVEGFVTWRGGTYYAIVELTMDTCSLWHAQSFTMSNNVFLDVTSFNRPAGGIPSGLTFDIMTAPQADPVGIDGVIPPANESLSITPLKSYTAGRNAIYTAYVLTTP